MMTEQLVKMEIDLTGEQVDWILKQITGTNGKSSMLRDLGMELTSAYKRAIWGRTK